MSRYIDTTDIAKQIADFKRVVNSPNSDYMTGYLCALSVTEGMIAKTPTADVEDVRHGEWKDRYENKYANHLYECSLCGEIAPEGTKYNVLGNPERIQVFSPFCPNCGAKMDGKRSEKMTCKDCKFFVQGVGRGGACQKKPYRKGKSGHVYKKPDGTPIEFVTYVGTPACKKYFERKDDA